MRDTIGSVLCVLDLMLGQYTIVPFTRSVIYVKILSPLLSVPSLSLSQPSGLCCCCSLFLLPSSFLPFCHLPLFRYTSLSALSFVRFSSFSFTVTSVLIYSPFLLSIILFNMLFSGFWTLEKKNLFTLPSVFVWASLWQIKRKSGVEVSVCVWGAGSG